LIPHRSAIQVHPVLTSPLNNSFTRFALRCARTLFPRSQRLETIESVVKGARSSRPPEKL
jgi:hypothetical protein